jgi:hypothetical protein
VKPAGVARCRLMWGPEEAAAALRDAGLARQRVRRLVASRIVRPHFLWWGAAWIVAYGGAQYLPTGPALALAGAAGAAATVLSRIAGRRARAAAVSGWETRFWRCWLVLAGGSLLLDLVDGAAPLPVLFLLPAVLWGVGMALYAIVAGDLALGLLGGGLAALAAALRLLAPDHALLLFGAIGGTAMIALGLVRLRDG